MNAPSLLACPACGALVNKERLTALAQAATSASDPSVALAKWREALELLPPTSGQAIEIGKRIEVLSSGIASMPSMPSSSSSSSPASPPGNAKASAPGASAEKKRGLAGLASAAALAVWKLKWLLAFLVGNGKIALLGLTKVSTLLSMGATVLIYTGIYGWKFALGFVLCIYIHEMGHVIVLRRFGIKADAPIFIPGLGAFVRSRQKFTNEREDAIVGLAGPVAGAVAALACALLWFALPKLGASIDGASVDSAAAWSHAGNFFGALARVGAWLNLFNLLPFWQLDGGRAFRALDRTQQLLCAAAIGALVVVTGEGILVLLLIGAVVRAFSPRIAASPETTTRKHWPTFAAYVALLLVLSPLAAIKIGHGDDGGGDGAASTNAGADDDSAPADNDGAPADKKTE